MQIFSFVLALNAILYNNEAAFFTHHIESNAEFNSQQCNTIIYIFIWHFFFSQRKYGYVIKITLNQSIGLLQKTESHAPKKLVQNYMCCVIVRFSVQIKLLHANTMKLSASKHNNQSYLIILL